MKRYRIPYGESNFKGIRTSNSIYVDKSRFIKELENLDTKYPIFLRPRRFGKTLFTSLLFYYYDINSADDFETLFGGLDISNYKTELANRYYVLRFDFSGIEAENEEILRQSFYDKIKICLKDFLLRYQFNITISDNPNKSAASLLDNFLIDIAGYTKGMVYVLIDEYDHFANDIIGDREFFINVTGKDGFVRKFYEVFKTHTGTGGIDRIFITGVTSITLDSLTSGFNIAKNISMNREFNEMMGFTGDETRGLLNLLGYNDIENIMNLLIEYYDGYMFYYEPGKVKRLLNSNLVLYFLAEYRTDGIPRKMADANIKSDYNRLTSMFSLYEEAKGREKVLTDIVAGNRIESNIITNFSQIETFGRKEFLSMLLFLGLLTIKGEGENFDVELMTPNAVIRNVYYDYYARYLELDEAKTLDAVGAIASSDNFEDFNRLIIKALKLHSNEDFKEFNEKRLKSIFLSCLGSQRRYLIKSEYESSGKRPDIALLDIRGGQTKVKYNYLIEIKYLHKSEATKALIEKKRNEAREQMNEYLKLNEFAMDKKMKGVIYVVVKDEIVCFEEV